jgi:L-lactate dehydrogenase complex protein LldG
MSARDDIFAAIAAAEPADDRAGVARVFADRCAAPKANLIPARGGGSAEALIARFVAEAKTASATVASVAAEEDVPTAIAAYLAEHSLESHLRAAPALSGLPWDRATGLAVEFGRAQGSDSVGVSRAFAGIAETGTLMTVSAPEMPMTLNFLPDTHIVLLRSNRIVGAYEDAWALLRAEKGPDSFMPRTINWITGPSRSADIELVLLLGVHGPRRLHILLIDGEET